MNKKWLLINPPTGKYIRDTRCQAAIERTIDIYIKQHHLAQIAKDVAAGAVLFCVMISVYYCRIFVLLIG